MENKNLTSTALARWISAFRLDSCAPQDIAEVRTRILDLMISSAAGWKCNQEYNNAVNEVLFALEGAPQSTVLFTGRKLPAPTAAYLNATYGHGADMDDGHRVANGHPGVALIPAVLALAEAENCAAEQIFEAILVGYETYIRLSKAVQPHLLHRGFHGTGVVGAVAASAACAKLLQLNETQIHHAISLGAVQASGLFEVSESGQEAKPINPANACRTGVESALLARQGVVAPDAPFEGVKGFFRAFADEIVPEEITQGLGESLAIRTSYIKLSPACRHAHPSIDAGIELGKRREIRADQIEKILIYTYPNAAFVTGKIAFPKNNAEGKFSMRYALAKALLEGDYSFKQLAQAGIPDRETEALIEKMVIITDPCYENKAASIRGGEVKILFIDGSEEACYVQVPRGDLENPLRPEDLLRKIRSCCEGVFDDAVQQALYTAVMENPLSLNELMELMCTTMSK